MNITNPNDSAAMINAVHEVFGPAAVDIERMIFGLAEQQCRDYHDITLWEFHSEDTIGFWAPMIDKDTVSVACPNYYENADMDRLSFGAAVNSMAINHLVWIINEKHPNSPTIKHLLNKYDELRDLIYRDNSTLDTAAIYNFLD